MRKIRKAAARLGKKTFSHFQENPYPEFLIKGFFKGVSDDKLHWEPITESKEYRDLLKQASRYHEIEDSPIINIVNEFVYDIGVNLYKKRRIIDLSYEIERRALVLAEELTTPPPVYIALAPVFRFFSDIDSLQLASGKLRLATYSERLFYSPAFPQMVHPYGPKHFDYVIELDSSQKTEQIPNSALDNYLRICWAFVASARLLSSGTAGFWYVSARNHVERKLPTSDGPGTVHYGHFHSLNCERGLRYGRFTTAILKDQKQALKDLFSKLWSCDDTDYLWRALRRYCGSTEERLSIEDSVLDLVIALESVFGQDKEKGSKRAGILESYLGDSDSSIINETILLWNARNALAHGDPLSEAERRTGGKLREIATNVHHMVGRALLLTALIQPINHETFRKNLDSIQDDEQIRNEFFQRIPRNIVQAHNRRKLLDPSADI